MADEEKAKAEKLAAAKKRVEEMKKKKAKKGGGAKKAKADDKPAQDKAAAEDEAADDKGDDKPTEDPTEEPSTSEAKPDASADKGGPEAPADKDEPEVPADKPTSPVQIVPPGPSLSQQSKMRSSSFRVGSATSPTGFPGSPDGDTAPEIYRKQVARIEDLEKENKRLAKEAGDSEKRWQKAEEELADLREADVDTNKTDGPELEKLKSEVAALQRQNSQLQTAASKKHGSTPSIAATGPPPAELQAQLDSKSATIENMELEISRLRAQAERQASTGGTDKEQIVALEDKVARSEQAAMKAQRELEDLKRNLERATERAVKEGSERTSAETKARTLERSLEEAQAEKAELEKKIEALDKKVTTMSQLHKEHDSRSQALKKEKERADKEAQEACAKAERLEAENTRLRRKAESEGGGADDDAVDELEEEERQRMNKKIRDLEAEVYDLRRGIWHQRRKDMEVGDDEGAASPSGGAFTNVDLGGSSPNPAARRASTRGGGGFGDFFSSGINALTGAPSQPAAQGAGGDDGFLDDDDMDFDEDAFRRAQEEDSRRRLERIKEIKRGLKNWEGWRLDLVDGRRGVGLGEVFEI